MKKRNGYNYHTNNCRGHTLRVVGVGRGVVGNQVHSTWLSKDKIKIQLHLKNPAIIVKEVECITSKTKGPKTVVVILTEGYDIPGSVSFDKRFNNQETLF